MLYLLSDETIKVKPLLKLIIDIGVFTEIGYWLFNRFNQNYIIYICELLLMLYINMCMLLMKITIVLEYIIDTM